MGEPEDSRSQVQMFWETILNQYAKQYLSWVLTYESGYDSNNICIESWQMSQGT